MESLCESLTFERELRLLAAGDFSHVFAKPLRVGNRGFTLLARPNSLQHARLGLAIAKKQVKLAVGRNLIKRKLRETFRQSQHDLPPFDFVVMVRRDINQMNRQEIHTQLQHLWRKTAKVCKNC